MATETTATNLMTADEFADWVMRPENRGRHYDLVRGEVVEMSRPGELHGAVCANVVFILSSYVRQVRRGRVLSNDTGLLLERDPDTVRGPDVVLFDTSRKLDQLHPKWVEDPPTLAVKVWSPNDRIGKMTRKINQYLDSGIRLVWVVDPEARDVTVYRKDHNEYTVEGDQELTGDDILPDLRFKVSDFFFVAAE